MSPTSDGRQICFKFSVRQLTLSYGRVDSELRKYLGNKKPPKGSDLQSNSFILQLEELEPRDCY